MRDIVFDIEANGLLDEATDIHCIAVSENGDEPVCYGPDRLQEALTWISGATNLIGHNIIQYDLPLLRKLMGWDVPVGVQIKDTFLVSLTCYIRMQSLPRSHVLSGVSILCVPLGTDLGCTRETTMTGQRTQMRWLSTVSKMCA